MSGASTSGVPACPDYKLDCRTRANVEVVGVIPTCTQSLDASRRRVEGGLGSKEVALLTRILSNGGRGHGGRAGAGYVVAVALQAEQ